MFTRILSTWLVAINFLSTAVSAVPVLQPEENYGQAPTPITITISTTVSVIASTCPPIPTTIFSYVPAPTTTITTTTTISTCSACSADEVPKSGFARTQETAGSGPTEIIPPPSPVDLLPAVPAHVDRTNISNL